MGITSFTDKFGDHVRFVLEPNAITVINDDKAMSRRYTIGGVGILDHFELYEIHDFAQVADAWRSGRVWFD